METIGINQILLDILYALRSLNDTMVGYCSNQAPVQTDEEWLHMQEVMDILKTTSRKSIYNWRMDKTLECKKFGRTIKFLKSSVYRLANK